MLSCMTRLYYTAVDNGTSSPPQGGENPPASSELRAPQLSRWRRMQIPIIAAIAYTALRLIGPTLRLEIVGIHNAVQIRDRGEPAIGAFWHRCIFPAIWMWRHRGIVVLNTVNFDGQWTRRVIERLGFGTAQGSSTRGAIEGLTVMAKRLQEGKHVALTIDGPRGPRYVAKPGAVILGRRTGKPVSVFHMAVEWGYTLEKSWDQLRLPYPFSRGVMICAPPIRVAMDADGDTVRLKQGEIQSSLERVRDIAEAWFALSDEQRDCVREDWRQGGPCRSLEGLKISAPELRPEV
jgi:lysophospholipid acyltransferase (LPLAT)-like uncharacterized protein